MFTGCDLVLPCRDEAPALPALLGKVPDAFHVIVVDNGSRDRTEGVARELGATVVRESHAGYGAAVHAGVEAATADYVAVMDADGSMDPADLLPLLDDVLIVVSELVTNAVLHARTDTRVTAAVHDGCITVAVGDDDPHHAPVVADRGAMAMNGRGVMLVDALASSWGVDLRDDSKVVWFEALFRDGSGRPRRQRA